LLEYSAESQRGGQTNRDRTETEGRSYEKTEITTMRHKDSE